jgi:2-C-methyl-D-erythritol 4-phosphate cytidylyltransferase
VTTLDSQRGDVAALLAAGGSGVRLGAETPKALCVLAGEPLLVHAVRRLVAAGPVGCLVVAAPPGYESEVGELLDRSGVRDRTWPGQALVVPGGRHRQQSVATALAAVPVEFEIVLVHDAARALTPGWLVAQVAAAVRSGRDAVIPVLPVTDTISEVDRSGAVIGSPDRSVLRAVQTPQGFRRSVLEAAHAASSVTHAASAPAPAGGPVTDDAGLVARLGVPVHTIAGSPYALKITTRFDLQVAGALLRAPEPGPP